MGPDLLVFTVNSPALEPDRDVSLIGVDRSDLGWSSPAWLLLMMRFKPNIHQVTDTVALCLEWRYCFVPICSLHSRDRSSVNDIAS